MPLKHSWSVRLLRTKLLQALWGDSKECKAAAAFQGTYYVQLIANIKLYGVIVAVSHCWGRYSPADTYTSQITMKTKSFLETDLRFFFPLTHTISVRTDTKTTPNRTKIKYTTFFSCKRPYFSISNFVMITTFNN